MIGAEFKSQRLCQSECVHFLLEREHQVLDLLGNGITPAALPKSRRISSLKPGLRSISFLMA